MKITAPPAPLNATYALSAPASGVSYTPTAPLVSTTVQAAIDEVAALIGSLPSGALTANTLQTIAASGAAQTLDVTLYNVFDITLTANCTLTISSPPAAGVAREIYIILRQGGTGSYTVTYPASFEWQDAAGGSTGSAPTLHTAVGALNIIGAATLDGGVSWGGADEAGGGGSALTPASTVTDETTLGITPAVGTGTAYARDDHTHGSPSLATVAASISTLGFVGATLIADTHSTPLVFGDLIQNEAQDDLVYADV